MPISKKPLEIQLALQGGGAKILSLLAVLEVVEEYEKLNKIKVTRVCGTSAGAIAGTIFASRVGLKNLITSWVSPDLDTLIDEFSLPKGRLSLAWKLISKDPLWNEKPIRDLLHGIFSSKGLTYFKDFKEIEVFSVSTNLRDGKAKRSDGEDNIVDALMDSAALPFIFRKWSSSSSPVYLDGGIGDNLPAQFLDPDSPSLPVAVSFSAPTIAPKNPSNLLEFCWQLLSAAIDSSTEKSHASVHETLFIKTTADSFNFKAARAIYTKEVAGIQNAARLWLDGLIEFSEKRQDAERAENSHLRKHPWKAADFHARESMKNLWSAVYAQHSQSLIKFHKVLLRLKLNSLLSPPAADELNYTVEFEVGEEPISCFWVGTTDGEDITLTEDSELKVWKLDDNRNPKAPVHFIDIPAIDSENPTDINIVLFFTPPLSQGRYFLHHREIGFGLMKGLLSSNKKDELGFTPARVDGTIELAQLVVDCPVGVRKLVLTPKAENCCTSAGVLDDTEIARALGSSADPAGFKTHVYKGDNAKPFFGVDIEVF